jgi:hypothetical protein
VVVVARLTSAEGAEAGVGREEAQKTQKRSQYGMRVAFAGFAPLRGQSFFPRQLDGFVFR